MANEKIGYFNLTTDGASAVVRVLHTSVETIESADTHWVESAEGKKKCVKCLGDGCPVCATNAMITSRIYVHLFDYTDGTEKVWTRTDKILPQLKEVQDAWGKLHDCVLKITRVGDNFPKYTVTVQNPNMYEAVDSELIDKKIAYRFYMTRSADELREFITTGVMPEHKSNFVPKDEYFKNKNNQQAQTAQSAGAKPSYSTAQSTQTPKIDFAKAAQKVKTADVKVDDDVFSDPFLVKPSRRV